MIAWVLYAKITINYIENNWLLVSSMFGAGIGTFITMRWAKDVGEETKKEENEK